MTWRRMSRIYYIILDVISKLLCLGMIGFGIYTDYSELILIGAILFIFDCKFKQLQSKIENIYRR